MSVNALWDLGAVVVGGSSAFNIDGISDSSTDPGFTEVLESGAGQVDPTYVANMSTVPVLPFTASDITTILGQIALAGMKFPQTTVITTVDSYFTQIDEGGTRKTGANHFRVRMNEGLAICRQIAATQDGVATADIEIHPTYDGTNEPFTYAASQSLPHTPSVDELFTLGGAKINGTQVDSLQGATIDFGIELVKKSADGQIFPYFVGILMRKPRITLDTNDIQLLNTFTLKGTAQSATDSVIYLRKIDENADRVADGTAQHISFTVDDGMIWSSPFGGSNNTESAGQLILQPTFDGTNAILVISTAATITGIS